MSLTQPFPLAVSSSLQSSTVDASPPSRPLGLASFHLLSTSSSLRYIYPPICTYMCVTPASTHYQLWPSRDRILSASGPYVERACSSAHMRSCASNPRYIRWKMEGGQCGMADIDPGARAVLNPSISSSRMLVLFQYNFGLGHRARHDGERTSDKLDDTKDRFVLDPFHDDPSTGTNLMKAAWLWCYAKSQITSPSMLAQAISVIMPDANETAEQLKTSSYDIPFAFFATSHSLV